MALATKCPRCNTIFRVAADQLKLRGGIVRCGSCHEVFDGNAALVEPAAKPTPVIPDTAAEASAPLAAVPAISEYVHGSPVDFEIDFFAAPAPAADLPQAPEAEAGPPAEAPPPAVWRSAAAPSPAETPAPSPDDTALAAVARAFASATAPAAAAPPIDEKLLTWEDIPANESARTDAAAMAAVARAFHAAATPAAAAPLPAPAAEPAAPPIVEEEAAPEEAPEAVQDAGASPVDAIEQWSADNSHPDGRIEPSLDTPQEHIILAALDDAHHFGDLPPADPLPADIPDAQDQPENAAAADTGAIEPGIAAEPALGEEPLPLADTPARELSPACEPWSLSEPERDDTALHAVAAVNTDAPDDGASLPDDEPAEEPRLSRRERALKRAQARLEASAAAQAEQEPEPAAGDDAEDLDHSDLSFVKRVDRSQKYGRAVTIAMAVGVPLLLAGLALQAATTFRDTLAANYPQLKPALAAICQPLGCKIALPAQLDALSVEQGELATMAENTFSFSTVLRNQSRTAQAWPHLELTLNDNVDKPVLRRVFAPSEYLASPAEGEKGFGPHSEQSIKLYFELKQLKASGYHIAIFYP